MVDQVTCIVRRHTGSSEIVFPKGGRGIALESPATELLRDSALVNLNFQRRGFLQGGGGFGPESPAPEQLQGSFSADSDSKKRALCDHSRVVAIIQGLHGALKSSPGTPLQHVISGQGRLFAELSISNREQPVSGPLAGVLGLLTQEVSTGDLFMEEAVATGDVAAALGPYGNFAPANSEVEGWHGRDDGGPRRRAERLGRVNAAGSLPLIQDIAVSRAPKGELE